MLFSIHIVINTHIGTLELHIGELIIIVLMQITFLLSGIAGEEIARWRDIRQGNT